MCSQVIWDDCENLLRILISLLGVVMIMVSTNAATPELREQISLNGTWSFTPAGAEKTVISVPEYWDARPGFKTDHAIYEREVTVPESFTGKRIKIEFESACQIAEVTVNDTVVSSHIGGWIPFSFDITDLVTPGKSFILKVDVKGGNYEPIVDKDKKIQWPLGWCGHQMRWGINSDVWLRAYGQVNIEDAYIITSYREKSITVNYELYNSSDKARTVKIIGNITLDDKSEKQLLTQQVSLQPGEHKTVIVKEKWKNPQLWFPYPDTRHPLYNLKSSVIEGDKVIDIETRRFGFREIWIDKNQYMINGIRLNLWGNSISDHHEGFKNARYSRMTKETISTTIDNWLSANIRFARFHMAPVDQFVLDTCDEKGFLVLEESAIYAREYLQPDKINIQEYLKNALTWIKPWVISRRNHPSIIQWSAENEMVLFSNWPEAPIKKMCEEVKKYDNTRPVSFDGDNIKTFPTDTLNIHYPERYLEKWEKPIYGYKLQNESIPNGIGEFLTSYDKNGQVNQWMHGLIIRGLRYENWTDIRPYTMSFILGDINSPKVKSARNGCAFVALFDKEYDNLGVAPLSEEKFPNLSAGATETRILALYNDEFQGTDITVDVMIKSGNQIYAAGKKIVSVPLGEHVDLPITFQVPGNAGSVMELILQTSKNNQIKFNEIKKFMISGEKSEGKTSSIVTIGDVKPLDIEVNCKMEFVKPPVSLVLGKQGTVRLTLTNHDKIQQAVGQVNILVEPPGAGYVIGSSVMPYSLEPGKSAFADFVIETSANRAVIGTRSTARKLQNCELPLDIEVPVKRLTIEPKLNEIDGLFLAEPAKEITYKNYTMAHLKCAVAGKYLVFQAEVHDPRINKNTDIWTDTAIDVFVSIPGTRLVRQVVFQPKGPKGINKVSFHENGAELPNIELQWKTSNLPEYGYSLDALIPLSLFKLTSESKEFLFDCAVAASPANDVSVQYVTVYKSYAAYMNNIRFAHLKVE